MKHKTHYLVALLLLTTIFLFKGTNVRAVNLDYNTSCFYETTTQNYFCTTTVALPFVEEISNGTNTFYLLKTWTYGELLLNFLIILIISVVIVIIITKFLYPTGRTRIET